MLRRVLPSVPTRALTRLPGPTCNLLFKCDYCCNVAAKSVESDVSVYCVCFACSAWCAVSHSVYVDAGVATFCAYDVLAYVAGHCGDLYRAPVVTYVLMLLGSMQCLCPPFMGST